MLDDAILEHEAKDTTYANCEKLAWLYIVRDHCCHTQTRESLNIETIPSEPKHVDKEFLPTYFLYMEAKKSYQQNEGSKEKVLNCLDSFLAELKEFFKIIYRNSDTPEERQMINEFISSVNVGNV